MSRGDIPIIVDACISFVTQHGEWVLADTEWGMGNMGTAGGGGGCLPCVCVICLQKLCLRRLQPDSNDCMTLGKLLCFCEPQFPHL